MNKKIVISLWLVFLFSTPFVFAETVILKSGETIEGKILERTDSSIKMDLEGVPVSYDLNDVDSIDNKKITFYNIFPDAPEDRSNKNNIFNRNSLSGQLYEGYWLGNERGVASMNSGDYDSAIKEFEASKEMMPKGSAAYLNLGIVFKRMGKDQDAIKFLEGAVALDPENSNIYYNLGNVYFESLQDYQNAMQCYLNAIQRNPDDGKSYVNLGVTYAKLGQNVDAKVSLEKAKTIFSQQGDQAGVAFAQQNLDAMPK